MLDTFLADQVSEGFVAGFLFYPSAWEDLATAIEAFCHGLTTSGSLTGIMT